MKTFKRITPLRKELIQTHAAGNSIGFVPTMGALHRGHLSLIKMSRRQNDITVVSIFINPTQFGPKEDFREYPRQENQDALLLKKEGVNYLFCPSEKIMYPTGFLTTVTVNKFDHHLCGRHRPGHFAGVATVVAKLINIVQPDRMYLGQKDAQQLVIVKKMVEDLNFPVKVKAVPTRRETDGLAMSSRNARLTGPQRQAAPVLYGALKHAQQMFLAGEKEASRLINEVNRIIGAEPEARIEYIECVNLLDLKPLKQIDREALLAVAVKFGKTRLIDNIILRKR